MSRRHLPERRPRVASTIHEIRSRHAEHRDKVARRKRQETPGELRQYTAAKPTH